ncbi:unnamed protein product [Prorocentrum cordatum]|uniref:Uncharacterized protein n=1 Tax=Prorocentrum cordatum TaxID=2364126 RepID=A0ABN9UKR9_9DINO|nr:unnamed protein product [Polarella glacialis]
MQSPVSSCPGGSLGPCRRTAAVAGVPGGTDLVDRTYSDVTTRDRCRHNNNDWRVPRDFTLISAVRNENSKLWLKYTFRKAFQQKERELADELGAEPPALGRAQPFWHPVLRTEGYKGPEGTPSCASRMLGQLLREGVAGPTSVRGSPAASFVGPAAGPEPWGAMSQAVDANEILSRKPKRRAEWVQKKLREEISAPGINRDLLYEVLTRKEGRAFASDLGDGDAVRTYAAVLQAMGSFTARQQKQLKGDTFVLRQAHVREKTLEKEQEKQEQEDWARQKALSARYGSTRPAAGQWSEVSPRRDALNPFASGGQRRAPAI